MVRGRGKTREEGFSSTFRAKNQELHDSQLVSQSTHARLIMIALLLKSGLSLRFQVAGYLLLVAGEVASSREAPPPEVFEVQLLPFSKRSYRPQKAIFIKSTAHTAPGYSYYDDHVFIKEHYNILRL